MKAGVRVSGASIAYRANASGYPLAESIRSMLPVCDEVVVNIGASDDGTRETVLDIGSEKVRITDQTWDLDLREKGLALSRATNRVLDQCTGDWVIYLQADEVLHESELPDLTDLIERVHARREIDGISFKYFHFYGTPHFIQDHFRKWYPWAVRAVRRDPAIRSTGDALKFRRTVRGRPRRLRMFHSGIHIYHYGWARPPEVMVAKQRQFERFYRGEGEWEERAAAMSTANIYGDLGNLRRFSGSHPAVMQERVKAANWPFAPGLERQLPRWVRLIIIAIWYPIARGCLKNAARLGLLKGAR